MAKNSFVAELTFNPLTVANRKFCYGLCMQNLVVTDISVHETPILQTGNSLIKNIYQSKFFFLFFFFFDLRVSISYKLLVLEISPGNVILMVTHQLVIDLFISCC